MNSLVRLLLPVLLFTVGLALGLAVWSARRLSRRVVAPLRTIQTAARRMHAGDLGTRVEMGAASGEIEELADVMNDLAGSLLDSQAELVRQATHDPLTGLWNRRALAAHLHARLQATGKDEVALLYIDLDDFKAVNDSLGHAAGDELLCSVSDQLRACTRGGDVVARLGGDEFAVLIEGDGASATSMAVAAGARILDALREPTVLDQGVVETSCSIGIAANEPGADAAEAITRNADMAMYVAKRHGKHRMEVFAEETRIQMRA